ncbi:helix-turn-helix domain-containing protein [Haloarchaeobius litoreus]|uniref:Helix-turn-helix domain-containing protein n=1 Tax=Haloarchaeobius litoreus TaxID=755306 RepID=A0ABD6DGG7_9EURY|nr:helix-turn-helix domain-containing protein [Haloarchaeobius litoreus]
MKSMSVVLQYAEPALTPMHRGLCESPALDREVVLGGQSVDGVETVSSFVYGEPDAYEALLADREAVQEYDITPTEDGCFVYVRQALGPEGQSLLDAIAQDTVVVVPPIEFRSDRTMTLTLVGHGEDLRAVLDSFPDAVTVDVRRVSDGVTAHDTAVSSRQQDALRAAWELGYYEVPRRNGMEAVADELDCAVSTASELLRRAEAHAVGEVLGGDV